MIKRISVWALGLSLLVGLAACSPTATPGELGEPPSPPAPSATAGQVASPTGTPVPSPTPQPSRVILLAPAGSDGAQVADLEAVLAELASQDGLELERRAELVAAEIGADVRLVVAVPPDPGLAGLAAGYPEVQFLAVGIPGLATAENLSLIGAQGERPDRQGFLAGYLAAVITQDWRVGMLAPADTASGQAAQAGFQNGVIFYCGLCRPAYPPFYQYPVVAGLPGGASQAEWQAAADTLVANAVQTVYVFPGAGDQALIEYLAQAGLKLIAGVDPPDGARGQWVATVRDDWSGALRQVWPRLVSGEGGILLETPLSLTERNEGLFSPGRQRFVERTLDDLVAGFIDTGADSLAGGSP